MADARAHRRRQFLEFLRRTPYAAMTKGQAISAAKVGIIPPVRSERERQLRTRYKLTLEDYDAMLAMHDGKCWSCGEVWHRHLFVDHDHDTGLVRGLLCSACNTIVGFLEVRKRQAALALEYLNAASRNLQEVTEG